MNDWQAGKLVNNSESSATGTQTGHKTQRQRSPAVGNPGTKPVQSDLQPCLLHSEYSWASHNKGVCPPGQKKIKNKSAHTALAVKACLLGGKQQH